MSLWKDWEWNIWWVTPHSSWEKEKKSSHLLKEIVCVREIDIKLVEWTPNWNEGMMTLAWLRLHKWIENRWNRHALTRNTEFCLRFFLQTISQPSFCEENFYFLIGHKEFADAFLATEYLWICSSTRMPYSKQAHPLSSNTGLRPFCQDLKQGQL